MSMVRILAGIYLSELQSIGPEEEVCCNQNKVQQLRQPVGLNSAFCH